MIADPEQADVRGKHQQRAPNGEQRTEVAMTRLFLVSEDGKEVWVAAPKLAVAGAGTPSAGVMRERVRR